MQKGITPVVAIILLLLITISIVGFAFVLLGNVAETGAESGEEELEQQVSQVATSFHIVGASGNRVYIRNDGSETITADSINVYVDGQKAVYAMGDIGKEMPGELKIADFPCGKTLKVTGPGASDSLQLDYQSCSDFNKCADGSSACDGFTTTTPTRVNVENKEYSFSANLSFAFAYTSGTFSAPLTIELDAVPKEENIINNRYKIWIRGDDGNKGCNFYHQSMPPSTNQWKLQALQGSTDTEDGAITLGNRYHITMQVLSDRCKAHVENMDSGEVKDLEAAGAVGSISVPVYLAVYTGSPGPVHTHYDNVKVY